MPATKRSLKQGSRASRLLLDIFNTLKLLTANLPQPGLAFAYGLEEALEIQNVREKYLQRQELKRLEEKKLLKVEKTANSYKVTLTNEGLLEALRLKILETDPLPKGQDCIVMFDIPESHRSLREWIRRLLKEAGFFCIQYSVWMSPFDAAGALADFFRISGKQDWIRVYTGIRS